jgi:glutaredoxin
MRLIKLLALGLIVFGAVDWMINNPSAPSLVTDAAAAEVEIYTTTYCAECKKAKAYMNKNGIAYIEYDVENDIELRKQFYARGGRGVPLLFVKGERMVGFNAERLETLLRTPEG